MPQFQWLLSLPCMWIPSTFIMWEYFRYMLKFSLHVLNYTYTYHKLQIIFRKQVQMLLLVGNVWKVVVKSDSRQRPLWWMGPLYVILSFWCKHYKRYKTLIIYYYFIIIIPFLVKTSLTFHTLHFTFPTKNGRGFTRFYY